MKIVIANRQRTRPINTRLLKQIVGAVLTELAVAEAELGLNLVGEREMTLINETFLQHAGSTDVITFDHSHVPGPAARVSRSRTEARKQDSPEVHPIALHGELFICVEEAVLQAKKFGTNWQAEVVRYGVHGILHLMGFDDVKPQLRRELKRAENRLMRRLAGRFSLAELARPANIRA